MKRHKKISHTLSILALAVGMAAAFSSCQKDEIVANQQQGSNFETIRSEALAEEDNGEVKLNRQAFQVSDEAVEDFVMSLGVNLDNIVEEDVTRPDGSVDHVFNIDDDIEVTRETLQKLLDSTSGRQYSTNYLVSTPRTIVVGVESNGSNHAAIYLAGIARAVQNYNELDLGLTFVIQQINSDIPNQPAVDILIYSNFSNSSAGAKAGFSTNSNPYPYIQMYAGMMNYVNNTDIIEHVVTHEIGHCIGLRHTDWFSRQSCGSTDPEGVTSYGANYIQGTHPGYDANSIMLACFNTGVSGEFSVWDKLALWYLY